MLRGTLEHPKFLDLQAHLDRDKWQVLGLLETLVHFVARYCPDGDVGKYPNKAIARAIEWRDDPDDLIRALVETRWLDADVPGCRLYVHDWHEHADDAVHNFLARRIRLFANGEMPRLRRLSRKERDKVEGRLKNLCAQRAHGVRHPVPDPVPVPVPEPVSVCAPLARAHDAPDDTHTRAARPPEPDPEPPRAQVPKSSSAPPAEHAPPACLAEEQRAALAVLARETYPEHRPDLVALEAEALAYARGRGKRSADWLAEVALWIAGAVARGRVARASSTSARRAHEISTEATAPPRASARPPVEPSSAEDRAAAAEHLRAFRAELAQRARCAPLAARSHVRTSGVSADDMARALAALEEQRAKRAHAQQQLELALDLEAPGGEVAHA